LIDLIFLLNKCLKQEGNQEDDGDQGLFNHSHDNNEDKGETDDELAE
jgi:hypothetical protein